MRFRCSFCEAFVADHGLNTLPNAPVRPPAEHSPENIAATTLGKAERKRPAKISDADMISEFCGQSFQTLNDAKTHYKNEHFDFDYSRIDQKRAKR